MTTRETYTVYYGPTGWECNIAVTPNLKTFDAIKGMVEFWSEWAYRLLLNNGDYVTTFLQQLAREITIIQVQERVNLSGVIKAFDSREGWCKMDGSAGIEILEVEDFKFEHNNFEVLKNPGHE